MTKTYLVVIDPNYARSIVAEYATFEEARARVDRELAHRLNGRGGMITFSFEVGEAGSAETVYRVNPQTGAEYLPPSEFWKRPIEDARDEAAVRNARMFGTDPSWYGR